MRNLFTGTAGLRGALSFAAVALDIKEHLGPVPFPEPAGFPFKRAIAVALAVGFCLVGSHYVLRRRRRPAREPDPGLPTTNGGPPDDLAGLPANEFYSRLAAAVRQALAGRDGVQAASMTLRELAAATPVVPEGVRAGWQALCERAEQAQYARSDIGAEQKREDLAAVRDLLREWGRDGV
jgi:hypothetical protein